MCGICGIISPKESIDDSILFNMVKSLEHRGPDNLGRKIYPLNKCGLAHARLSIIDLSSAANQPMEYEDLVIVFNGEIYNYKEIKEELLNLGHIFRLESDTEVILHAFKQWGCECVKRFIGMFAFAILDRSRNKLYLFRDRAGVKPLYYYDFNGVFLFSSELKAFIQHPYFEKKINSLSVGYYFKQGNIPAPYSIYENCYKLLPGNVLEYNITSNDFKIIEYWNVLDYYIKSKSRIDYREAKETLRGLLISSCNYRMLSDVPVGVFLSGGYDSAGVTAILQSERSEKIKTFTIGFEEGNNEADAAKSIANYLGTDHHEYICKEKDAQEIIPILCNYYDEPFADSSAIPTTLVSRFAKEYVTVALSADGGDETFYGYNSYSSVRRNIKRINNLRVLDNVFSFKLLNIISLLFNKYTLNRTRINFLSEVFSIENDKRISFLFESMQSLNKDAFYSFVKTSYPDYRLIDCNLFKEEIDLAAYIDYINYLPNDILTKVDRAAMSVSLESREPLLDHRLIEFSAQLPSDYKYNNTLKRIYKDVVHEYIPNDLMNRPKTGFSIPINSWLKKDLSYILEEYISKEYIDDSILNSKQVLYLKKLFKSSGVLEGSDLIWKILVFQMWYKKWIY